MLPAALSEATVMTLRRMVSILESSATRAIMSYCFCILFQDFSFFVFQKHV